MVACEKEGVEVADSRGWDGGEQAECIVEEFTLAVEDHGMGEGARGVLQFKQLKGLKCLDWKSD